jgi:CubicO group peptidase (beta-lactamase class C family)
MNLSRLSKILNIKWLFTFSIYLILATKVIGQTNVEKIQELITIYNSVGEFNGCLLVAEDGKIILEKAVGFTDYTTSNSLKINNQFRLASVSKQFTAMAVMILHERNKLSYDDEINKYLIDFPYNKVTVRNLLNHTGGLPEYGVLFEKYLDSHSIGNNVVSNKDVYELLKSYSPKLLFEPGDKYQYSNTGYAILALLVENISNQSFQDFMLKNIFIPLGMLSTYVNPPTGKLKDSSRAKGFIKSSDGAQYMERDWNYQNGMYGDGGIISTVHDLFLWDKALKRNILVNEAEIEEAYTEVALNDGTTSDYGFGWSIINDESGKTVVHGGGWLGYTAGILRDLSNDITVIQLCNMPSKRLIFQIWDIMLGKEFELPDMKTVTFIVNSETTSANDSIFITGNNRKLGNWNPNRVRLQKNDPFIWERTFFFEKGLDLKYKITRGSWDSEGLNDQKKVPDNYKLNVQSDTTVIVRVPFWKDDKE